MASRDTYFDDETQLEQNRQQASDRRREVLSNSFRQVMGTPQGRQVLFTILGYGDLYDMESEMPVAPDYTQRCLGRRDVALRLLKELLSLDNSVYILMQQEAGAFEAEYALPEIPEDSENG